MVNCSPIRLSDLNRPDLHHSCYVILCHPPASAKETHAKYRLRLWLDEVNVRLGRGLIVEMKIDEITSRDDFQEQLLELSQKGRQPCLSQ